MKTLKVLPVIALALGLMASAVFAETKTDTFKVKGIMCQACTEKIEASLKKVDGVLAVKANLEDRKVKVTYDDSKATMEKIHNAIVQAGFGMEGCDESCCTKKKN